LLNNHAKIERGLLVQGIPPANLDFLRETGRTLVISRRWIGNLMLPTFSDSVTVGTGESTHDKTRRRLRVRTPRYLRCGPACEERKRKLSGLRRNRYVVLQLCRGKYDCLECHWSFSTNSIQEQR
jgi:hypothetical protein